MIEKQIPEKWRKAICKALDEKRLYYRCTDAQGRACNGGKSDPLPWRKWSEKREAHLCRSGWHLTNTPHRWCGSRVWLVEGSGALDSSVDNDTKVCFERVRVLAEVDPQACLDPSALVRCAHDLRGAYLRGADLRGADLTNTIGLPSEYTKNS